MKETPQTTAVDAGATGAERRFSRVLVANRGEIALRIIRACRDLGLESVALYTRPDAEADFVGLADDAWLLPGDNAAATYLDIDAVLGIAARSGAQAVHPGYGYLSESPEFARAVIDAGLVWVGPDPEAIRTLGDKSGARASALAVDAPVTRGSDGPVRDADHALEIAEQIGYPVAVKAVHGGGGRGFRTAANATELPAAFESASREAQAAFGDGTCLLEQQIVQPRHVETQCMADGTGRVLVASTRDCTLQRRNQKILEEAPAPFLTEEQITTLEETSKRLLAHVGYKGAATCEFLLDRQGRLFFMEANARIQVEHTVTEEITGVDLVAWQLRIALGETLPEAFPAPRGHALQFRVNAEDPDKGFFPATGTITRFRAPSGPGVRLDSGVRTGSEVGTTFDPMLAKLIVTGEDRPQAIARARRALREFELEGVTTLLGLHAELLDEPAFAEDLSVSTLWLQEEFVPAREARKKDKAPAGHTGAEGEPTVPPVDVVVEVDGHRMTVTLPGELAAGGKNGQGTQAAPRKARRGLRRKGAVRTDDSPVLTAPMQANLVTVDVAPGDTVEVGDRLCVIEAMKMEQPLEATHAGTVKAVPAAVGTSVKAGTVLVEFES
ncbi:acetyl/propionyl/methylcrotonyl-CoA carboxylase subunit alpha [Brevibacterium litoralis]|uniref:acetyl/propionyl/methylcrotonyl-CoA carboxylase subunit alpha n=1 Tax=Brevibacterium litoralis TaxID=3138935 RepID=UPI0032EF368F